jgi:hypothetical protein
VGGIPRGGLVPREQRPDIGAAVPAGPTGKARLEIGQADFIGLAIGIDEDRMGAAVILAIDQKPRRA